MQTNQLRVRWQTPEHATIETQTEAYTLTVDDGRLVVSWGGVELWHSPLPSVCPMGKEDKRCMQEGLLVIAGTSGAGKTTVERTLAERLGARALVSTTTRDRRSGERWDAYDFADRAWFMQMLNAGRFAEVDTFGGELYGVDWWELEHAGDGRWCTLVMTPQGLRRLTRALGFQPKCVWLDAPDGVLRERLTARDGNADRMSLVGEQRGAAEGVRWDMRLDTSDMDAEAVAEAVSSLWAREAA